MNTFMNNLQATTNFTHTENGAITHKSTLNGVLDLFALGGAYRGRNNEDCIVLFKKAYEEDAALALKCLFYLRDVRGGQGERRFFRVIMRWLASYDSEAARRNITHISEYGRWDDLYCLFDTPLEKDALAAIRAQLELDVQSKTPSLLAKWMKSENTSSRTSRELASTTRKYLGMTPKQYRKTLSILRERIRVLERLMSANRWDEIEFDKIPSKAGLIYKNAFARRDIIKAKYEAFAKDTTTKVNAEVLNPVDIAHRVFNTNVSVIDRAMLQKYWDNLKDYYNGREENAIAVVDVSGSMTGIPREAAVSMGAYIAERGRGPFTNHFITFSEHPHLVRFEGVDVVDKFKRAVRADWGMNTNLEAVFDLLLNVAKKNSTKKEDMPDRLYIFSDMEFDIAFAKHDTIGQGEVETLLEGIAKKWASEGYALPHVIFWNLDARHDNIPALNGRFSYVSGFSMTMVENILSGKDGIELMLDKLNSERYALIH